MDPSQHGTERKLLAMCAVWGAPAGTPLALLLPALVPPRLVPGSAPCPSPPPSPTSRPDGLGPRGSMNRPPLNKVPCSPGATLRAPHRAPVCIFYRRGTRRPVGGAWKLWYHGLRHARGGRHGVAPACRHAAASEACTNRAFGLQVYLPPKAMWLRVQGTISSSSY